MVSIFRTISGVGLFLTAAAVAHYGSTLNEQAHGPLVFAAVFLQALLLIGLGVWLVWGP